MNPQIAIGLWLARTFESLSMQNLKREEGQSLAEYGLILALIAIVVTGAVVFLQGKISGIFSSVGDSL